MQEEVFLEKLRSMRIKKHAVPFLIAVESREPEAQSGCSAESRLADERRSAAIFGQQCRHGTGPVGELLPVFCLLRNGKDMYQRIIVTMHIENVIRIAGFTDHALDGQVLSPRKTLVERQESRHLVRQVVHVVAGLGRFETPKLCRFLSAIGIIQRCLI